MLQFIKISELLYTIPSPLEQFEILSLFKFLGFNLTNQFYFLLLLICTLVFVFAFMVQPKTNTLYMIPGRWQLVLESIYCLVLNLVKENINGPRGQKFFPIIFSLFLFVASMNLIGLIPYSYTITSHFIITFALSLSIFIGINIICIKTHKLAFFSLFLPSGTSFALAFLLVPVELISYLFKPLSLAIRLFCNMMAGHTLLKVFAGFSWSLMHFSGSLFFLQAIPILILIPLYGLELGVALIQAFVFSLLTCIYLNDAVNLH